MSKSSPTTSTAISVAEPAGPSRQYSEEAIRGGFADELASGRLAWRVVNIDEPENKHFVQDFELVTKSLVLVEYQDGKVTRCENLQAGVAAGTRQGAIP